MCVQIIRLSLIIIFICQVFISAIFTLFDGDVAPFFRPPPQAPLPWVLHHDVAAQPDPLSQLQLRPAAELLEPPFLGRSNNARRTTSS